MILYEHQIEIQYFSLFVSTVCDFLSYQSSSLLIAVTNWCGYIAMAQSPVNSAVKFAFQVRCNVKWARALVLSDMYIRTREWKLTLSPDAAMPRKNPSRNQRRTQPAVALEWPLDVHCRVSSVEWWEKESSPLSNTRSESRRAGVASEDLCKFLRLYQVPVWYFVATVSPCTLSNFFLQGKAFSSRLFRVIYK